MNAATEPSDTPPGTPGPSPGTGTRQGRTAPVSQGSTPTRRRRSARALLALAALGLCCLPFTAAWWYDGYARAVTPQAAPPGAAMAAGRLAPPADGWAAPPVVLAYHDIGPGARSRYTVTPKAFDAQLAALSAAGYRTLSSEEFLRSLRDGHAPAPRSVYLTFDDGTHGLWVYADRILARYRMRAASFLIGGRVGHHRPYYLSWQEIARMARSGRWDFQDHTSDLHRRAAVDARGRQASALANRLWLAERRRMETAREYEHRVGADLDRSIGELTRHGLPRPRVFAYPFSEASGPDNLGSHRFLRHALNARFATALTNTSRRPLPAGRRAAAAREVQRVEVTAATTVPALLERLGRWTAVPPAACPAPLSSPSLWHRTDRSGATGPGALTGAGPYPGRTGYAAGAYRTTSSADWDDYTVEGTVANLEERTNNIGMVVRDGSLDPVAVAVSYSNLSVLEGSGSHRHEVARRALTDATSHRVRITVRGERTEILVDGRLRVVRVANATGTTRARGPARTAGGSARAGDTGRTAGAGDPARTTRAVGADRTARAADSDRAAGTERRGRVPVGDLTGGIAISVRNGAPRGHWPRFTSLTVRGVGGHR